MIILDESTTRAIQSLSAQPSYYKVTDLLHNELTVTMKNLISATPDRVQALQSRAQLLEELLVIFSK